MNPTLMMMMSDILINWTFFSDALTQKQNRNRQQTFREICRIFVLVRNFLFLQYTAATEQNNELHNNISPTVN